MNFTATRLPYRQTGAFNKIVLDYIDQAATARPFFQHPANIQGVQQAIAARKQFANNRNVLVEQLEKQYAAVIANEAVSKNIRLLLSENTFTITTAHQNNLFTGPLYFIYKIIHVIKLADQLNNLVPGNHFVPVYYIGSEDADFDELNHAWIGGEKLTWQTDQSGAVGRMIIDKALTRLIDTAEGQLAVLPHGATLISLLRECYKEGTTIQDATFHFVHALFASFGLVILLPDNAALKQQMLPVFEDDLLHQKASGIVEEAAGKLEQAGYKIQAHPREINLFYLENGKRERIESNGDSFAVVNSTIRFTKEELLAELHTHPGRFSPNVILRGLYQETILPNIAFIGGGGETAYWLQLKNLFTHYQVPFPVLVLRNSFLIIENKWQAAIAKLGFSADDIFLPEQELLAKLVIRQSKNDTNLNGSLTELEKLYDQFRLQAGAVDSTLMQHVEALKTKTVYRLRELEKKMLRAEKRKYSDQLRQIHAIKEKLFPGGGLQERRDNIACYYAKWGEAFLKKLYDNSLCFEQEFVILGES